MAKTPVVHWELIGPDGEALKGFYSSTLGWEFAPTMEGFDSYFMTDESETGIGGAVGSGSEDLPSYGAVYFQVESIDETLGKVAANGGDIVQPRTEIPDVVVFGIFKDPAGNLVGLTEASAES
jgi:predicted enzyme related to lactoylglutathione lyase